VFCPRARTQQASAMGIAFGLTRSRFRIRHELVIGRSLRGNFGACTLDKLITPCFAVVGPGRIAQDIARRQQPSWAYERMCSVRLTAIAGKALPGAASQTDREINGLSFEVVPSARRRLVRVRVNSRQRPAGTSCRRIGASGLGKARGWLYSPEGGCSHHAPRSALRRSRLGYDDSKPCAYPVAEASLLGICASRSAHNGRLGLPGAKARSHACS
jgi:hypothetical protein